MTTLENNQTTIEIEYTVNESSFDAYKDIKTYIEACKFLGKEPQEAPEFITTPERFKKSMLACMQLITISKALNAASEEEPRTEQKVHGYEIHIFKNKNKELDFKILKFYSEDRKIRTGITCYKNIEAAKYAIIQFKNLYINYLGTFLKPEKLKKNML